MLRVVGFQEEPEGPRTPGVDWQGGDDLRCLPCYLDEFCDGKSEKEKEDIEKRWKGDCKKSLRQARARAGKDVHVANERSKGYMTLHKEICNKYPEATSRRRRELTIQRIEIAAVHISRSLINTPEGREALVVARDARIGVLQQKAMASDDLPVISPDGMVHNDATLQFFSDISPDGEHKDLFVCHRRHCEFPILARRLRMGPTERVLQHMYDE